MQLTVCIPCAGIGDWVVCQFHWWQNSAIGICRVQNCRMWEWL